MRNKALLGVAQSSNSDPSKAARLTCGEWHVPHDRWGERMYSFINPGAYPNYIS